MTPILHIDDPRTWPDFDPALLPQFDGGEWPPVGTRERQWLRAIEFGAIYYAMNRWLVTLKKAKDDGDALAETAALQELCAVSQSRDALEDHYAAEGFLAEPILEGSRYVNVQFVWAGKPIQPQVFTHRFKAELIF